MSPAFKKYSRVLLGKLKTSASSIKIEPAELKTNPVANDFSPIAMLFCGSSVPEEVRFEQMSKAVTAYDQFKQKYAKAQGEELTQLNRFATKEFDAQMLALKLLVSAPSHNQLLDTALLEQHFAVILNIDPSRFKIKLSRQLDFNLASPVDLDLQIRADEANTFSQFHEALKHLGIIRNDCLQSRVSEIAITQLDPPPVLRLAQFEISEQSLQRTPSKKSTKVDAPSVPDKKLIQVAVHLKEFVKTEHDFVKQMKVLSDALTEKGEEGCQALFKATEGHNSAAKNNLEQKIPTLYDSLEQNKYIVRAELESEGVKLTEAEEFVLKKLEQYYLLKNAIDIFKTIADDPYPWLDEELATKILKAAPEEMAQEDLREWLTQLYNRVKANNAHVASQIVALRWVSVHFNDLRKILNDKSIVTFDAEKKISVGITGMQGETVEKTQQEIKDTYLISPVQRLPRYDMLLKELMTSFNKVTLENLSINNFNVLNSLIYLRNFFLARNKSTNERIRKHEQDQARDKPKGNEQNASPMQDSVGLFFSALNAFFSSVTVKSSIQGGDAGSLESMGQSMIGAFDDAPLLNLHNSFLNQSFRFDQSDLGQQSDEVFDSSQQSFLSSINESKLFSSSRIIQTDQAEIENLLQKSEDIQVSFTNEEEAYKKLSEALNASEKIPEAEVVDPSQEEPVGKPVKILTKAKPVVELKDEFSLYIHNAHKASIDIAFQEFGPDFDEDVAKPPMAIKDVKLKILSESKKIYFANKPDLKSTAHKINAKPTDKIVWYVDADQEDPKQVKEWAINIWDDLEKHRGYFIVVGHGDFEAFQKKWGATQVVVEKAASPVLQPAMVQKEPEVIISIPQPEPKQPEPAQKFEQAQAAQPEPQKEPEKPKEEIIIPVPQPKAKESEQPQAFQLEPQREADAQPKEEVVILAPQLEPKKHEPPNPEGPQVVLPEVDKDKKEPIDPEILPKEQQLLENPTDIDFDDPDPPDEQRRRKQATSQKKNSPSAMIPELPPGVVRLTEEPPVKYVSSFVASKVVVDTSAGPAVKSPSAFKTFLKGFFNPSVWGIAMLFSMAVGIGAGALVGFSEPFFDIMMSIGVSALPVFAGLWAISAIVYLGRLAVPEAAAHPKKEPSGVFVVTLVLGMLLGLGIALAGGVLLGLGGIPSELSIIKSLFDVIGHFLSTGLKVMGLDTLSNAFAMGGNLSSGVAAFLIIAAPVFFTLILAERLVTAYFFSDEDGQALGGSQQQDSGNGFRSVPKQPEASVEQLIENLLDLQTKLRQKIMNERSFLYSGNDETVIEKLDGPSEGKPAGFSIDITDGALIGNIQQCYLTNTGGILPDGDVVRSFCRLNALYALESNIMTNLLTKSKTDPDCIQAKASANNALQSSSAQDDQPYLKAEADYSSVWATRDTDFLAQQISLIRQGFKDIDAQHVTLVSNQSVSTKCVAHSAVLK